MLKQKQEVLCPSKHQPLRLVLMKQVCPPNQGHENGDGVESLPVEPSEKKEEIFKSQGTFVAY